MVFSSITFLFFFLSFTLLLYALSPVKLRNLTLLLASLLFYAWGEGIYLAVMLLSILLNYCCGLAIDKVRPNRSAKALIFFGVGINLLILAFFKYANFFIENINALLAVVGMPVIQWSPVHLPIGISFFTFQAMSYLIDVYKGSIPSQASLTCLSLYIALFPQLIAGPIVRYGTIAQESVTRRMTLPDCASGIKRFIFGLSKKVLLANPFGVLADQFFSQPVSELSCATAWFGALCYTFQIYFDFSGYSDMAIGLGKIFGFHFPENFNYPYFSKSFREFWHRWHISLSSWLRDYLYIPLGGNRDGDFKTYRNLLIVFLLCGLWHGANWTFVFWGLYHGIFLALERTSWYDQILSRMWLPMRYGMTFLLVMIGWVFFRSDTLHAAMLYLETMFTPKAMLPGIYTLWNILDKKLIVELCIATILSLPVYPLLTKTNSRLTSMWARYALLPITCSYLIELGVLCLIAYCTIISLASAVYNPFIYFRF
jgi:alginate O-acetyltransferase complex protein AlgI